MKITQYLLLVLILHSVTGCTLLQSVSPAAPDQIDSLIEKQQYTYALSSISSIPKTDSRYNEMAKKKDLILQLIKTFETSTIQKAQELQEKHQWNDALALYTEALNKVPDSTQIKNAQSEFLIKRKEYTDELEFKMYLLDAEWAKNNEQLLDELIRSLPSDLWIKLRRWDFNQKKSSILENLTLCIEQSIQTGNHKIARRCLNMIKDIDHNQEISKSLLQFSKELEQKDKGKHKLHIEQANNLINELKQGYSHENLLRTSQQLLLFETNKNLSQEEKTLQQTLQQHLDKGITQSMEAGREMYSANKIKEALSVWESLREISPDNEELEAHISRAQRVLEKLKDLNTDKPAIELPAR
ncbi:MAG: hypothetical protein OEY89_10720 [Gammaproteobacteria bacterium]|nr:hypothetical protein [Gammaproteobacteria bacterium]